MKTEPVQFGCPEDDLTAAKERIRELEEKCCESEQELESASAIIDEQDWKIEELKVQLETADMMLDEGAEARRRLERRIDELEDVLADEPCPVLVPREQVPPQQP